MPRVGLKVRWLEQRSRGDPQDAEVHRDVAGAIEAPADQRNLATVLNRSIHDLLHPVDGRGKAREEQGLIGFEEDVVQHRADRLLRRAEARHVGVGRISQQQQHVALAILGELLEVEDTPVERSLVNLEVAGVQQQALWGGDRQREALRGAVGYVNAFDRETAQPDLFARGDRSQAGWLEQGEFRDLLAHHAQRERGAEDWHIVDLLEQVRHAADVVQVAVG